MHMLLKLFKRSGSKSTDVAAGVAEAPSQFATSRCTSSRVSTIEQLEARQFLSAALKVENLDIIPGYERVIFNKIGTPHPTVPTHTKTTGRVRLTNTGTSTLTFSNVTISGPFKLMSPLPASLARGASATITLQFVATRVPTFTYNQTAGTTRASSGGVWNGTLTFRTNDPRNSTYSEGLSGYYQNRYEDNQEPGLQTIVNVLSDYKTNIAPTKRPTYPNGATTRTLYGEEVNSAYWTVADSTRPVGLRHIAAFKGMTSVTSTGWYLKSNKQYRELYKTDNRANQSLLPYKLNQPTVPAHGTFSPGAGAVFGFKVDKEFSDDKLNNTKGGGHHIRFYPLRDHFGNVLPNTYLMAMDYSDVYATPNYDFQDNVYVVTNVKPAGN
jgi:hypothetical protein